MWDGIVFLIRLAMAKCHRILAPVTNKNREQLKPAGLHGPFGCYYFGWMKQTLLLCAWALTTALHAQTWPLVEISRSYGPAIGPCEPSIAIDLDNPAVMTAGTVLNHAYRSRDFGKTWRTQTLKSKYGVWGDPCLVAMGGRKFAYFHLSDPLGTNWATDQVLDRIVCQVSTNGGRKWSSGKGIGYNHPKDQDKEWAAYHRERDLLVVTWTQFDAYKKEGEQYQSNIMFSISRNQGKRWSMPTRVNSTPGTCLDDSQTTEGATPVFGPSGELDVVWSRDEKIFLAKSFDGGSSWSAEQVIAPQKGGWDMKIRGLNRCNGMPVLQSDQRGGLFVVYGEMVNDHPRVRFIRSTDGGQTWTKPKDIHPPHDSTGLTDQFLPWLAYDATTKQLHVVYYHRDKPLTSLTRAWMATSTDLGDTWTNQVLSARSFEPGKAAFFGDYTNIAAVKGVVRPIWTEVDGNSTVVYTALIPRL